MNAKKVEKTREERIAEVKAKMKAEIKAIEDEEYEDMDRLLEDIVTRCAARGYSFPKVYGRWLAKNQKPVQEFNYKIGEDVFTIKDRGQLSKEVKAALQAKGKKPTRSELEKFKAD